MAIKKRQVKVVAGMLAATMLFALPLPAFAAKPSSSSYQTIQLKETAQKEVVYYNNSSAIPGIDWVKDSSALTFLPTAVTGDVTSAVKDEDGVLWIGTENGLQRVDFAAEDPGDIVQYLAGPRYLYGGDNHVTGLASDGEGGIWVQTASGVTHISMKEKTLSEKAAKFEQLADTVNDRRGMKTGTGFTFTDSANPGIVDYNSATGSFSSAPDTDDNDGLWTSMYAIGEIFRYATLVQEYGESPSDSARAAEVETAKDSAIHATKAVLLLDYVSGRGNGFPARSYMLTSEPNAATVGGSVYGYQNQNGFWFQNFVGEDAVNPNGIIPSMQRDDVAPIGYSMVRVTKDAMTKKGSNIFGYLGDSDVMNFNGFGLSPEAIEELNKTRPDGQKLGTDIYKTVNGYKQVLPVITAATDKTDAGTSDTTTSETNKPLFQLTVPVYEQIPTIFNDLFPSSALKEANGQQVIDMNQIVYKADTSSDEVVGHYALFFSAYKYLIGNSQDGELATLKPYIVEATHRMTELILKDGHYYIEDATGKSTQWSRWFSKYFNDNIAEMESQPEWAEAKLGLIGVEGSKEDGLSYGFEDAPLNSLELMSALKTASFVTAADYPVDSAKYQLAYDQTFSSSYSKEEPYINGQGYINMALEYIQRRVIRQSNDAYNVNEEPVTRENIKYSTHSKASNRVHENSNINATLHGDWTQYINYSDEELAWFALYPLILQETDETKRSLIVQAFDQWYENEKREENPFYTFLYQLAHPERTDIDVAAAVDYLYRIPQFQITFQTEWNRQDVFYIEPGFRDDYVQTNHVLPKDERLAMKNNGNPFEADNQAGAANPNYGYNGSGLEIEVGSTFTLPYWLGRYFEIIKE